MREPSSSFRAVFATLAGLALVTAACSSEVGEPGPTGRSAGSSTAEDGATKKAGEVGCDEDAECETNVCFKGNAQHFCTVRCTVETAQALCVAPYTGTCNKQGYCKRD